ncbi:unnamed protein product [Arctia plantaginis]|uniref:RPA-interacting protein C-terminal domain-containing protein n=1 Tax=Arctia plantaginis TaxID=874455 RepID=A0A8S0ZRZ9_ARCPL|nr:unnamed protein product [Arctia plantaginis]CAB3242095.1 unnamed protein product [Arctia plantaginis]
MSKIEDTKIRNKLHFEKKTCAEYLPNIFFMPILLYRENSFKMTSVPKFHNLALKQKSSPIEIKEKMRKDYKSKVQNCRGMLMDKFRGSVTESELHNTLTDIYKSMFKFPKENINEEEVEFLDELKGELVQEELEWWTKECERCQMLDVDWSSMEESNNVICPVCQKIDLQLSNGNLRCTSCSISIPTQKSLAEIKNDIFGLVDNHNSMCNSDVQFGLVTDFNESHVYLLCESCTEMKLVI